LLQPTQQAALIEAVWLADIPNDLRRQIETLQQTANEHGVKVDYQLRTMNDLQAQLAEIETRISKNEEILKDISDSPATQKSADVHAVAHNIETTSLPLTQARSNKDGMVEQQEQFLATFKSYLEDKAAVDREFSNPWPPATLSVAYLSAIVLASIASNLAGSMATKHQLAKEARKRQPVMQSLDYQSRVPTQRQLPTSNAMKLSTTHALASPIQAAPFAGDIRASLWVSDWSHDNGTYRDSTAKSVSDDTTELTRSPPLAHPVAATGSWSQKLSKLEAEPSTNRSTNMHDEINYDSSESELNSDRVDSVY
jgi:hypothetical protein